MVVFAIQKLNAVCPGPLVFSSQSFYNLYTLFLSGKVEVGFAYELVFVKNFVFLQIHKKRIPSSFQADLNLSLVFFFLKENNQRPKKVQKSKNM